MTTTKQVIENFLMGDTKGKASSINIEGDKLFNYHTVIAQRINGVVHINITKYSSTTTKHQNVLRRELTEAPTVEGVQQGAQDLERYIIQEA